MSWLRFETFITCRRSDNTHPHQDRASLVTWIPKIPLAGEKKVIGGIDMLGGETHVTTISVHGSFTVAATPRDLQRIGVRMGGDFYLTINGTDEKKTIDHQLAVTEGIASATADSRLTPSPPVATTSTPAASTTTDNSTISETKLQEPLSPVSDMVASLPRAPSHPPGAAAVTPHPSFSSRNGLTVKVRLDVYPYVRTPSDYWVACEEPGKYLTCDISLSFRCRS
jgi:hypothetical protein